MSSAPERSPATVSLLTAPAPHPRTGSAGGRAVVVGLAVAAFFAAAPGASQVKGRPVSEGSGPVSELSTNVGDGSRPVHERGRTVRAGNPSRLSGNSVRASAVGTASTGPVSDISVGPVTQSRRRIGTQTVTDVSEGSVKLDRSETVREPISDPLRELGPLQEQLRRLQPLPRDDGQAGAE